MTKAFFFAIARKLGYLVAAMAFTFLLSYLNPTQAATYPATLLYSTNHTSTSYPTVEEAKTAAQIARKNTLIAGNPSTWVWTLAYIKFTTPSPTQDTFLMRHNYMRPDGVGAHSETTLTVSYVASCPAGATLVNGSTPRVATCTDSCVAPQKMVAGVCTLDACESLKGIAIKKQTTNTNTNTLCKNNCVAKVYDSLCLTGDPSNVFCLMDAKFTGASCTPDTITAPTTPEHDCIAKGQSYGTVNGVVVCTKAGTPASAPTTTTKESDKTTTNTATGATNTTTTTTTSNTSNNTVTTTTTGTDANGNAVNEQVTQDATGFCESNPNSSICQASDDLCGENPDIPACKAWCDKPENDDKIACMEKGDDLTADEIGEDEITLNFNPVSGIPSASGCPTPDSVSIGGRTIPLSYEGICDYAAAFKFLVLIFSWISAAYIVSAAVNQQ